MKDLLKVWAPALTLFFVVVFTSACQKETLTSLTSNDASALAAEDRGGGGDTMGHHHHPHHPPGGGGGHPHPHDSIHPPHDSIHPPHHPHDSIRPPHGGGHHPHDSIPGGGNGCNVPPTTITVAELPQAAQTWLGTNLPGVEILSVRKVTRRDCKVEYIVRAKGKPPVRFDADGNKIK